ncbi:GerMN domain-containing protein [Dethiobacter alkaliphilus]|uniref:GerMN domain-containing protein n=1 Tax=Dethiobacter alkaliphilus TaxID=427926 RepID=UPI0022277AAB|nr:GerMN domain-containing protein [Dethiobacter alkaliphilus]MCW3491389.1 GerMN domain-containing protein [Dethiobacter alkaliphilus]
MRKTTCLLAILILLFLSGCGLLDRDTPENVVPPENGDELIDPDRELRETVFYLPAQEGQVLVPVRIGIPWEEGIAKATLLYTREGNLPTPIANLGLAPLLPAGTQVLGLTIRDGLARVDFSEEFLQYNPELERQIISGIVFTLTEFPTVHEVEIMVEGKVPAFHGSLTAAEPFDRDLGLNLEISSEVDDFADTKQILLYFLYPVGENAFYVPVTRVVEKTDNPLQDVVQELIKGPGPGSPLFSALPKDLELQSVSTEGDQVTILVSGDFAAVGGGQLAADRIRHQVALTLTEISGVMNISLLSDGEPPQFPAGIHFPETFGRPRQWNTAVGTQ